MTTERAANPQTGVATDRGPRPENQDSYWLPPAGIDPGTGLLYLVLDGVGGQQYGREAAEMAGPLIANGYYQARSGGHDVVSALRLAIEQANSAVHSAGRERGTRMGCTVVAAVICPEGLVVAHAGDARAYLLHDRQLVQLTEDHTWVREQVHSGTIRPEDAAHHELRNVVTRVLGNEPMLTPVLGGPVPLYIGDRVLLCSDGLHDALAAQELNSILAGRDFQAAAQNLVDRALQNGTTDNVTALVIALEDSRVRAGMALFSSTRLPLLIPLALVALMILFLAVISAGPLSGLARPTDPGSTPVGAYPGPEGTETSGGPSQEVGTELPLTATFVPEPSPTPTLGVRLCPKQDYAFVWTEEQMDTGRTCYATDYRLPTDGMELIEAEPRVEESFSGGGLSCGLTAFFHVRIPDPRLEVGWVPEYYVFVTDAETCP